MKQFVILCLLAAVVTAPFRAQAADAGLNTAGKKGAIVGKAALYGFGGGLVVGVASQVFKRKTKNIFLFGSLGLYAGIALGLYVISTGGKESTYDGPDTYEDYMGSLHKPEVNPTLMTAPPAGDMRVSLFNVSF